MTVWYTCPRHGCIRKFESVDDVRRHQQTAHSDDPPQPTPDGGQVEPPTENQIELDGELRAEVVFTVQGIEFRSDPLGLDLAQQVANAMAKATVPIDLGERPLCDDERARLEPVEVTDDE